MNVLAGDTLPSPVLPRSDIEVVHERKVTEHVFGFTRTFDTKQLSSNLLREPGINVRQGRRAHKIESEDREKLTPQSNLSFN